MPLTHLPAELICHIAECLPQHERLNLRLTCSQVERATFGLFKSQFREIGFMITTRSLEILREISEHPELAGVVEHIWFNPDCFTHVTAGSREDVKKPDESTKWWHLFSEPEQIPTTTVLTEFLYNDERRGPPDFQYYVSRDQFAAFESCLQDYVRLLYDFALTEHLSLALRRFHGLRVLGMRRGMRHRPFGMVPLTKAIGLDPRVVGMWPNEREVDKFLSNPTCFFAHLLLAMSEQTIKLERLYTDGVQIDQLAISGLLTAHGRSILGHPRVLDLNIVEPRETTSDRDKDGEMYGARGLPESCGPFELAVSKLPIANELGGLGEGVI